MSNERNTTNGRSDESAQTLEELITGYLDELHQGGSVDPVRVLAEHPDQGPELLEALEAYVHLGESAGDEDSPPLGTLGDYTLRRQIGRGGMGVVYEAWEGSMDRAVALKVLPSGIAADDRAFQRFCREAKLAGKISHPNVVPVYGMGIKEDTPHYAMEYVEGETLAEVLGRLKEAEPETDTPFGPKDDVTYFGNIARAFADVADGLQHAHSKGVIHRDIKPSNLILDGEGRLRILDFGLARLEGQESLTFSGDVVGTPAYMSPEQAKRKKISVDHRTDVYSLGATLYELLTHQQPFRGKDHNDTLSQIIERDPRSPRQLNPRVPVDLETIVLKCLRKDAAGRYGTAEALAQDLRRFVRGDPVEARPLTSWERTLRSLTRHRRRLLVGALVAIAALVFGAFELSRQAAFERSVLPTYRAQVEAAAAQIVTSALSAETNFSGAPLLGKLERHLWRAADFQSQATSPGHGVVEAIRLLEDAARLLPARPDAHIHLARGLHLLGKPEDAERLVRRILSRDRAFVPARLLLAQLRERDEPDQDDAIERLVEEYQGRTGWETHYLLAQQRFLEKRWREAAQAYNELLDAIPPLAAREPYAGFFVEVSLQKGIAYLESGELREATKAFIETGAVCRELIEPRLFLAKAYYRRGELEAADAELAAVYKSVSTAEKNRVANWATVIFHSLQDFARVHAWSQQIDDPVLSERLEMYSLFRLGNVAEAEKVGRALLERGSHEPVGPYVLAVVLFSQLETHPPAERSLRLEEIVHHLELALGYDGEFTPARHLLKAAHREQGRQPAQRTPLVTFSHASEHSMALARRGFFSRGKPLDLNSPTMSEQSPVITPSGLELFYSAFAGGTYKIFVAAREHGENRFAAPVALESVNTRAGDYALGISGDGLTLYITSLRAPSTDWDIWQVSRESRDQGFAHPERLGPLHTPELEASGLGVTADGRELYFDRGWLPGAEIELMVASRDALEQPWGVPVPLTELNREGVPDSNPAISADGLSLFYTAKDREGGSGDHDNWLAVRTQRTDAAGRRVPFGKPVPLGPAVSSAHIEWQPKPTWDWPEAGSGMYYSGGLRGQDMNLYFARWHLDCNENLRDDADDITQALSSDSDGNGVPDECEAVSLPPQNSHRH